MSEVEDDFERAEKSAQTGGSKIAELGEELKVLSNNVKSQMSEVEDDLERAERCHSMSFHL